MITIKCGYEGCDWKCSPQDIVDKSLLPHIGVRFIISSMRNRLIKHLVQAHNIPPAIWEK